MAAARVLVESRRGVNGFNHRALSTVHPCHPGALGGRAVTGQAQIQGRMGKTMTRLATDRG